jgi:hypothetical protein
MSLGEWTQACQALVRGQASISFDGFARLLLHAGRGAASGLARTCRRSSVGTSAASGGGGGGGVGGGGGAGGADDQALASQLALHAFNLLKIEAVASELLHASAGGAPHRAALTPSSEQAAQALRAFIADAEERGS